MTKCPNQECPLRRTRRAPPPWRLRLAVRRTSGRESVLVADSGVPKNQVDSDKLEGRLAGQGYRRAAAASEADLVVINTCAFIESARQESIDTVLELADLRRPGARLVVTGCMAERYGSEITDALPEVDLVAGFGIDFAVPVDVASPSVSPSRWRASGPTTGPGVRSARVGPSGVGGPLGLREGGRGV